MAGDWIKMRADLLTHPKVVRIASALKADRLRVVGGLHAVWCLFDAHSVDGKLEGYTLEALGDLIGWAEFPGAMVMIDWLIDGGVFLETPRFDEHNGQSAKRRAQETDRKREERKSARNSSANDADKKRTREEKRRIDSKPPIPPVSGGKKRGAISLETFLQECKDKGEKLIRDEDTIFEYAAQAEIPREFLGLHYREFRARYCTPDAKRYKDWRAVFRKSVRGNWFRLWRADANGDYVLTTEGVQAKKFHEGKAA